MRKFDTNVQVLKYDVLKEVSNVAFDDKGPESLLDIPKKIVPGPEATMRCCIYKERAIVEERIKLALGGDKENPNVIEVLNIACDECPVNHYTVGESCRGCIAHRCMNVCPVGAISIDAHQHAKIDQDKCIKCGRCAGVCPFSAISKSSRPCEKSCKINAISMDENKKAKIDNSKCISCGACVYQCPFGAIVDKSFITDVIKMLKESEGNTKYKVYATIASQYSDVKIGQVVSGIKKLGFADVIETALGADIVADSEARELAEKGTLTSSCCPAFVYYIKKSFPKLESYISHNLSPMGAVGRFIKQVDPTAKVVFIGPCTAKKMEFQEERVRPYIDSVITFEELQALLDSREIDLENLEESQLDNASFYGRIFARSGGVATAVEQALKENGITEEQFPFCPVSCNGIEECKVALLKLQKGVLKENFIEGMACVGGCIGGAACLTHEPKNKNEIDKYGKESMEQTISGAIKVVELAQKEIRGKE